MRIVVFLLTAVVLTSCSKPDHLASVKQQVMHGEHDPKQYSLLNEQIVYNDRFAEIMGADPAKAIKLDPGVLAIRIYWTVFANKDSTFSLYEPNERWKHMANMRIQLFLEDNVPVQLLRDEGTLYHYESFVRSGFQYFPHKLQSQSDSMWDSAIKEFYNRIVLSNEAQGAMTSVINRYKRTLVPGVTAIEFDGGLYKEPFAIFLYTGDEPASSEIIVTQQDKIALSAEDYDPALFFRVNVPSELTPVLNQPFRNTAQQVR